MNAHPPVTEEVRYRLLRYLEAHPDATQREIAVELGVSLGKVHYCLHALMEKGLVKVRNFKNSRNKAAYVYVLTPRGIEEKIEVAGAFLRRKIAEYDGLARQIEHLRNEVQEMAEERKQKA